VRHSPHTQHKNTRQARGCTHRQYEEHLIGALLGSDSGCKAPSKGQHRGSSDIVG
jgi:hypothetical protein